jgi:zinc and cadmium transporter
MHEIPQEIGDFGLLLYSGFSRKKAVIYNLVSAFFAIGGALLFYFFSNAVAHAEPYALAFAAGNMMYIASVDLLPEMHKEKKWKSSAAQFFIITLGAAVIFAIAKYLE